MRQNPPAASTELRKPLRKAQRQPGKSRSADATAENLAAQDTVTDSVATDPAHTAPSPTGPADQEAAQNTALALTDAGPSAAAADGLSELQARAWPSVDGVGNSWALHLADAGTTPSPVVAMPASGASPASNTPAPSFWGASSGAGLNLGMPILLGTAALVGAGASNAGGKTNPAVVRPKLSSISGIAATDTIVLRFDTPLDALNLPQRSQFTVTQGANTFAVAGMTVSADGMTLTLVVNGDLSANPFSIRYNDASTGDDVQTLQSRTGVDVDSFQQGLVADGPIQAARIYIDANRDGVAQDSEFSGITTDRFGRYILQGIAQSGPIIATGGVNVDTGIFNTLVLKAPEGSMVVNPITTLVQSLSVQRGISAQQASSQLATALGLNGLDLTHFDPLAAGSTATGLAAQKIAAQVASLVQSLASNSSQSSALMDALATHLVSTPPTDSAPLLAQPALIQALMSQVQIPQDQQSGLLSQLQGIARRIDSAASIAEISTVQASAGLDETAPAAPTIKMVLPTFLDEAPEVVLSFNTDNSMGRAALSGHVLTLKVDGQTYTHTLTADDIAQGWVAVTVAMSGKMLDVGATLTDLAGNVSPTAVASPPGSDTLELGTQLALPIQGLLQTLGNQELPLLGPLDELTNSLWGELQQWLSLMPTARLQASSKASQPLAGLELDALTGGEDDTVYTLVFDDTGSTTTDDSLPPWLQPDDSSSGESTTGDTGSDGSASGTSGTRVLIGRNTGQQFEIPDLSVDELKDRLKKAYSQNLETGEFTFNLQLPFRIFQKDMLGHVGVDGAQARVDGSFDSYGQLELNLEGKFDAKKYAKFDIDKSKLELKLNGGLKEGSQFALQLGPVVVAASDLDSARIDSSAERQNTGLLATVSAYLKDNDGKADKTLEFNPATLTKFFDEISDRTFKIPDWYALKVDAYGQLSAQALGRADLQWGLPDPQSLVTLVQNSTAPDLFKSLAETIGKGADPIYSLLTMLSPQISAKLLVPASFSYDSRLTESAMKSEYGKVYFDDIRIGAQTLMSSYMEPGLNLLNTVMKPFYLVEDLVNSPLNLPSSDKLFNTYTPPSAWPGWIQELASGVVNAPANLTQQVLDRLQTGLDRNADGKLTVFEIVRSSVDAYHSAALDIALFWNQLNQVEGIKPLLDSAGTTLLATTGVDVIKALKSLAQTVTDSVTRPIATDSDPHPLSPLEKIQLALDTAEQVFNIIDQLQGLQALYEAAQDDLQRLSANGDTDLSLSLGSYVWDIGNNAFSQTRNAYEKKTIDYSLPSSSAQVALLTQQEAIKIIFDQVKAGTASAQTLSPELFIQAGVNFDRISGYAAKKLGSGVTQANFNAICDVLNHLKGAAFTKDKDWTDSSLYSDGKLLLTDSFTQDLNEIAHYNRIWRMATGQEYTEGWGTTKVTDNLHALGVITVEERTNNLDAKDFYKGYPKYGADPGSHIMLDIIKAQKAEGVDTWQELKELWQIEKQIEDLTGNRTTVAPVRGWKVFGPSYSDVSGYKLSFEQFERIGLPILSRSDTVLEAANKKIWDIPGYTWAEMKPNNFKDFYNQVANIIRTSNSVWLKNNGTDESGLVSSALQKFMTAADPNGDINSITLVDFQTLGISAIQASELPFFRSMLDSDVINAQEVNTVARVRDLVDAVNTVVRTANDQAVDAKAFYSAIDLLLGKIKLGDLTKYPDISNSYAEVLNYIPRANIGGINQLKSTESLPLFQAIVKRLNAVDVDTYDELRALADITKDIELTTMKANKVWDTHSLAYHPTDLNEKIVTAYKNYKSTLSAADLKLLGYENADNATAIAVQTALADFNKNVDSTKYTRYTYTFGSTSVYKDFTTYEARVTNLNTLDLDALDKLVGDYSNSGFFTELLSKSKPLKDFWDAFRKAGFDLPFISDPAFLQKLWTDEPLDLLTFKPAIPSLDTGVINLFNLDLIEAAGVDTLLPGFSAPLSASFAAKIQPHLSFGIDTGGLIQASDLPDDTGLLTWDVMQALLNGFYINDLYTSGESLMDLPELDLNLSLQGLLGLNIGKVDSLFNAYAQVGSSLDLNVNYDLNDDNADEAGKVRMGDLFELLFTDPLSIGDLEGSLKQTFSAQAKAVIDITPSDWGFLKDSKSLVDLTKAVATALDFLGWNTDYTLIDKKGQTTVTWLDSDPATTAPSLLEFVNQIKSLTSGDAVI